MQVAQLAKDLKVEPDALLHLLREMGIAVAGPRAPVSDADVARVLARVERERRGGKKDTSAALEAALEEASSGPRRRRRRRAEPEPEPEPETEETAEDEVEAIVAADEDESAEVVEVVEAEDELVLDVAAVADEDEASEAEAPPAADEPPVEPDEAELVEASAPDEVTDEADETTELVTADEREPAAAEDEDEDEEVAEEVAEVAEAPAAQKPEPARTGAPDGPVRVIRKPTPAASAGPGGTVRIQAEGYTSDGRRKRKDKKGKKRGRVDQDAVQENLQRVMAELKGGGGKKRRRKGERLSQEEQEIRELEQDEEREREARNIKVNEFLTVAELSELMDMPAAQIVGAAFKNLGLMVTINQRLDFDQIELLLDEFGFTAEREEAYEAVDEEDVEVEDEADLKPRPPVVTVMGHVDHGKTLLLDRIRKSNVVAGEAGGITQHIGAYHVEAPDNRSVTFLDTPGHAAFTAMRARGADVTDIVILIVAADDSVMPQTVEAISHAKNAGVPLLVAVNKVDLPAANPEKVKQELLQHDVQVEDFGGDVLCAEISAKTGQGIDDLLEKILLQAEMLELRANPDREAQGTVVEAQLDVGKGPVVTILVQRGTLRVGDDFLVGYFDGRVRAMLDERGKAVAEAGPGIPVQILGAGGVPQAGDVFQVMEADRAAETAGSRQRLEREKQLRIKERGVKLGDFSQLMSEGQVGSLPLIIKADVDGSVQALADALEQLGTDEVEVQIIHRAVGAINESDVLLAETAGAVIIGFRVRPDSNARQLAERSGVDIQSYDVIYNAVDDVRAALEGMLSPEQREEVLGSAEVREIFKISRVGTIAGCFVTDGVVDRKARGRVVRDGIVVYDGEFSSLKRFKDDVREVREGFECGIGIANFNDIKVGDVIECYRVEEVARTLTSSAEGRG
jgi:translation initiation factor IF-2